MKTKDIQIYYQDEPQSVYFEKEKITIHPVFAAYRLPASGKIIKHSIVIISDDQNPNLS